MKAVICPAYGPPEVLQITEVENPVPKDNEVLIRIYATTVTAADFRMRSFTIPTSVRLPVRFALGFRKPKKPILGIELAGEIESVGKAVTRFKNGDQVFAATLKEFGAYAEFKCLPEDGAIAIKPANITYEEAAALPIGARTALHYLRKANIREGQKVLIYGASGSVGTYAVQLAKHFGAEVTGVCSRGNLDLIKSLGADKGLDYNAEGFNRELELYDIIFLAVDKWPFSTCRKYLKADGIYINITEPLPGPRIIWASITSHKKIIMGEGAPETAEALIYLKALVEAGNLKPVIDRSYSLDQIVEAHRYVDKGRKKGNVAITINHE
ncbi:NAD(P)-dependent alcohol dehydrogenase [Fulvivirgaceae bacterium BMA12]|uniref:NAD(P)-dependent alcohol dehydrogenase n=1 Tax=Agaribacillus aureus TaxID=3051825 RepID=A0ABT8LEZ7_9BACT|nr:NAD(P)-dependent alcohol dehydrogenase [Fulvivirgaceae bacterium BMA12]